MSTNESILICDGELEIIKITEELYDQAIELFVKYFMKYETFSIATNLLESEQCINEMKLLLRSVLSDGISFAARHRSTNGLVAMACNKIIDSKAHTSFDDIETSLTSPSMKCIGECLTRLETTYNIFKEWNIDCTLEIMFLSTRSDFGRRGLALKLSQHSIDYAKKMLYDKLPKDELSVLPEKIRNAKPKAITSVFTSRYTQAVGKKLGFESLTKISFKDFMYEGKTFAEKIDPIHEYSEFAALKI